MSAAEIARKQIIKEMAAWLQDTVTQSIGALRTME